MNTAAKLLFVGLLVMGFLSWRKSHRPVLSSAVAQNLVLIQSEAKVAKESVADPCENRTHCVYLYIAPWCPHCHNFLPQIANLRSQWQTPDRPGLKVVIGMDKDAAIDQMAKLIEGPTYSDSSAQFSHALGINSVPQLIVVNAQNQVQATGSDSHDWINAELKAHHRTANSH